MNLKPCPFCGKREHLKIVELPTDIASIDVVYVVYCTYCGGQIRSPDDREHAIKIWNRREKDDKEDMDCPV